MMPETPMPIQGSVPQSPLIYSQESGQDHEDPIPPSSSLQLVEQRLSSTSRWEGFVYTQGEYRILDRSKIEASIYIFFIL
jgi:hypothetical protein